MSFPMLPCIYKQLFGISCPLCGFQRSLLCLLQGNIFDCIKFFPPFFLFALHCGSLFCLLFAKEVVKFSFSQSALDLSCGFACRKCNLPKFGRALIVVE